MDLQIMKMTAINIKEETHFIQATTFPELKEEQVKKNVDHFF